MTSNREKINWEVPAVEWGKFLDYVREKYDAIDGHTGREVEMAMKEWVDRDEYHGIEERINRLVRAAGRTPADLSQKKSPVDGLDVSGESTRVGSRVHSQLKTEFRAFVNEHTDLRYGIALAHALRERRHGGRSGRLEDKLDRVIDDAESLLGELSDSSDGLTTREKRTIAICQEFIDRHDIQRYEVHEEIAAVAGDSKATIEEYTTRVLDRLDYVLHPGHRGPPQDKDIFKPADEAREIAESIGAAPPDAPAIDRKHYSELSREEKIEAIQIELARQSQTNGGRYQFNASRISREVFDDIPSPSHVNDLMHAASDPDGYTMARYDGKQVLRVNLNEVRLSAVNDALDTDDESESEGNQEDESDSQNKLMAEATEEMDALMDSRPKALTDGGIPE